MASGLLLLLDDIASVLDDVATLTKVAVQKTSGVLGDDLALNAQQVSGVAANRELPIVWAVAKGSLFNKAILVPAAILLSAVAPWAIIPLLIFGGGYLCFEGVEKLVHSYLHPRLKRHHAESNASLASLDRGQPQPTPELKHEEPSHVEPIDVEAIEKEKVAGAVRTDFILSAEIIVITLGTVAAANFWTRVVVLVTIAIVMTAGVYGLVAAIVKLDDLGAWLVRYSDTSRRRRLWRAIGLTILSATPYLMKGLSIAGTAAMFLVGGGIIVHGIPSLHVMIEHLVHPLSRVTLIGPSMETVTFMILEAIIGILVGLMVLLGVTIGKHLLGVQSHH